MIFLHDARFPRLVLACSVSFATFIACSGCGPETTETPPQVPIAPALNEGDASPVATDQGGAKAAADDSGATPDTSAAKQAGADNPADETRDETIAGIRFRVPAAWKRAELTPSQQGFIDARFEIPAGDAAVSLTCSSTGGGRQANIDRWIGQFRLSPGEQPQTETLTVDGAEATWVDLTGTFDSRMPGGGGPRENWRMLGVAIAAKQQDFYLKLTGPRDAVSRVHDEFRTFAQSARLP